VGDIANGGADAAGGGVEVVLQNYDDEKDSSEFFEPKAKAPWIVR